MQLPDYFRILGLKFGASDEEIKTAYRKLSKKFHPYLNEGDRFFEEKFKELQEAYEVLTDPMRKEEYLKKFTQNETQTTFNKEHFTKENTSQTKQNNQTTNTHAGTKTADPKTGKSKSSNRWSVIGAILFAASLVAVMLIKNYLRQEKNHSEDHSFPDSTYKAVPVSGIDSMNKKRDSSVTTVSPDTTAITSSNNDTVHTNNGTAGNLITISKEEPWTEIKFNQHTKELEITPAFTISNAKGIPCHAVAYFYDNNGTALKTGANNIYRAADGTVSSPTDFTPAYDNASYNLLESDFTINLPYSEIPLPTGSYNLQYKVELFDDKWNVLTISDLQAFFFIQN